LGDCTLFHPNTLSVPPTPLCRPSLLFFFPLAPMEMFFARPQSHLPFFSGRATFFLPQVPPRFFFRGENGGAFLFFSGLRDLPPSPSFRIAVIFSKSQFLFLFLFATRDGFLRLSIMRVPRTFLLIPVAHLQRQFP